MKIFLTYRERLAGLFIVFTALLVVTYFAGAAIRNRWLAPRVSFQTVVARGDGLRPGAPVLLSGVEIGEVGALTIRNDDRIDVELVVLGTHAHRVRAGTRATVRRLLGIGEKRVYLTAAASGALPVLAGARIESNEPTDLLDVLSQLDLDSNLKMLNRGLSAMEVLLKKLEEEGRLDRLVSAADRVGPTLEKVDAILGDLHKPLVSVVRNPALTGTLEGAASALEPERVGRLLARAESLLAKLETLSAERGPLASVLGHTDQLITDGRIDKLISSLERLTGEEKLGRIIDNVATLTEETSKIGPEIPEITRELVGTLREATILLKALQRTWILEGTTKEVREEMRPRE